MNLQPTPTTQPTPSVTSNIARRTVCVRFDPARLDSDPISVEPEVVQVARGAETEIDFELEAARQSDERVEFPSTDFIHVEEDCELTMVYDQPRRVKLFVRSQRRSEDPQVRVPYRIRVAYNGRIYTSSNYPGYEDRGPDGP